MPRVPRAVHAVLVVALLLTGTAALVPRAAAQPATARFIVVLRDDVADPGAVADEVARRNRGTVGHVYRFALKGFSVEVPVQAIQGIARNPHVASIEPDQLAFALDVPTGVDRIEVDKKLAFGGSGNPPSVGGVDIAIIDTGIYPHGDLTIAGGADCTVGNIFFGRCADGNPGDDNGHGTHVAGTAAANGGVVGVAPGARLWSVKVLGANGSGYISGIVAGIDWVTRKAGTSEAIEVANMSLGCQCSSAALTDAITNSTNAGVVYVVAAGNDGMDAASFTPANHPRVIAVSAVADYDGKAGGDADPTCRSDAGADDTLAAFSNFGSTVDIAAPGVCIASTWNDGGYRTISGTSMASPHVAGAAALYVRDHPGANWSQVRDGLRGSGWSVPASDDCGFDGGSGEPFLLLAACDFATSEPPANEPPTAEGKSVTTDEDEFVPVTLSGSDAESCELTFSVVGGPTKGQLSGITSGNDNCTGGTPNTDTASIVYTPNANTSGADSFTYKVSDGATESAPATVSITVNAVNDAPTATEDAYGTDQDVPLSVAAGNGVLANDGDVEGDSLTTVLVDGVANGTLELNADGSFTYTPDAGFSGADTFTYTASDGSVESNIAVVTLTVNPAAPTDDPPTVSIVSPTGGTVSGTITVQIEARDNEDAAGTLLVMFAVDGGGLGPVTHIGGDSYTVTWDTTQVGDGPHTLTASATDSVGQTTTSDPVIATVSNPVVVAPPAAPSNLSGTSARRGRARVDLTWTDNADNELGFILYRCLANTAAPSDACAVIAIQGESTGVGGTVSYRDIDVIRGDDYTYFVVASNDGGLSAPSNAAAVAA